MKKQNVSPLRVLMNNPLTSSSPRGQDWILCKKKSYVSNWEVVTYGKLTIYIWYIYIYIYVICVMKWFIHHNKSYLSVELLVDLNQRLSVLGFLGDLIVIMFWLVNNHLNLTIVFFRQLRLSLLYLQQEQAVFHVWRSDSRKCPCENKAGKSPKSPLASMFWKFSAAAIFLSERETPEPKFSRPFY